MNSTSVAVIIAILLFAILGMLFRSGTGFALFLEDEAEETNKEAAAKFTGNLMLALSGAASMWLLYLLADFKWALYIGSGLFLGLTILSLFYKQGKDSGEI
jgi:hypothetical protein